MAPVPIEADRNGTVAVALRLKERAWVLERMGGEAGPGGARTRASRSHGFAGSRANYCCVEQGIKESSEQMAEGVDQLAHVSMDFEQAAGHRSIADPDAPTGDVADAGPAGVQDAIPGHPGAGVEAEYAHHGSYDSGSP